MNIPSDDPFVCETIDGGVCAARGFKAGSVHAGFKKNTDRCDLAVVCCDHGATAAGVFTQNIFCAALVQFDREQLAAGGQIRAVVINAGIANAATGTVGLKAAQDTAAEAAVLAGCLESEVLVASTGVIGVHLPLDVMKAGLPNAFAKLGNDAQEHDLASARAIMTTDTVPKRCAIQWRDPKGVLCTLGGMCKGSGMISPNMATMICVLTTDAAIEAGPLNNALHKAVNRSFNLVTVDSDTSTNDTCVILASGDSGSDLIIGTHDEAYAEFERALIYVCENLARQIAADGEGATKLVNIYVTGAASQEDADIAARTVANSPLVKTAIAGHDANWGRIAAALGRSGAAFDQNNVNIDIMRMPVLRQGLPVPFDEQEALARFEDPEILIACDLGAGAYGAHMWTCDFTHEYISINADYRS
ncbi:MAG: bifunctional glutamate N-acetyltransferase/amino-acid acetyltransferase ArgJ [Coriobacteriales bacterium]|nr:bifunctional glutamate N-acetyltransferase/amino-acid acetyltransferase ArgJ [Coriobacteriales bacterium]